jgi:hypothetical protein
MLLIRSGAHPRGSTFPVMDGGGYTTEHEGYIIGAAVAADRLQYLPQGRADPPTASNHRTVPEAFAVLITRPVESVMVQVIEPFASPVDPTTAEVANRPARIVSRDWSLFRSTFDGTTRSCALDDRPRPAH